MSFRDEERPLLTAPAVEEREAPLAAADLGLALARAMLSEAGQPGEGTRAFARSSSLDPLRLQMELTWLLALTTRFAVAAALPGEVGERVIRSFDEAVGAGASKRVEAGYAQRLRDYHDAFTSPHPELGRAYSIGNTFARLCGSRHEVPVIEYGARAYVERLPRLLTLLGAVNVV